MTRWLKFIAILFSVPVAATQVELVRCVNELKSVQDVAGSDILYFNGLVLAMEGGVLLIVNDREINSFRLYAKDRNSVRATFPHSDPRRAPHTLYLTLHYSRLVGSRFNVVSMDAPPLARKPQEFRPLLPMAMGIKAKNEALARLISAEISRIKERYQTGRLSRRDLLNGNLSLCRNIAYGEVRRDVNFQINELELVSSERPSAGRMPASVGF